MGGLLSIETGIRCNNRCLFCYQRGWRGGARFSDPDTEALVEKLAWGRSNGYDEVGFSGGEPTLREDFLDLVRKARELGYRRVSLTTNGRRFNNREYAGSALEAGLDSIGWSLHGADAGTHDALVGREGAFRQVISGVRNVGELAARVGRRVDRNLFVLVNRLNAGLLADVGRLGLAHGIRLVVLQPVVFSKGNLASAAGLALPLEGLLAAVRRAALAGRQEGWLIKLFNLPPCFFPDIPEAFEHQRYPVEVFRVQESGSAGESRLAPGTGFVRLDRCFRCVLLPWCPGLHQSLLPQEVLFETIVRSLAVPSSSRGDVWLSGTELLSGETLVRLLVRLRSMAGVERVRVCHGGDSVAGEGFLPAALRGGATDLALVLRPEEAGSTDLGRRSGGNAGALLELAGGGMADSVSGLCVSVAVPYVHERRDKVFPLLLPFARTGRVGLEVHFPWDFKNPEVFEAWHFGRLFLRWRLAGGRGCRAVVPDDGHRGTLGFRLPLVPAGQPEVAAWHVVRHWLSGPAGDWVVLSGLPSAGGGVGRGGPWRRLCRVCLGHRWTAACLRA